MFCMKPRNISANKGTRKACLRPSAFGNTNAPTRIINSQAGFVALISTIIIGAILVIVVFALSFGAFVNRFNVLDVEFKEKSIGLAEACVDAAIILLQGNSGYVPPPPPGQLVTVQPDTCYIWSVSPAASWPKTIKVQAKYPNSGAKIAYTNLEVVVSKPGNEVVVDSWKEIANLP